MNAQERELVRFLRLLDGLGCLWPFLDPEVLGKVFAGLTRKERLRVTSFLEAHGLRIS